MEAIFNLIYSEDITVLITNVVSLCLAVEFISATFYLVGRIAK